MGISEGELEKMLGKDKARRVLHEADTNRNTNTTANMEQNTGNVSNGKKKAKRQDSPCHIHIHSARATLADADGVSGKAAIDGLIHSGILDDDSPEEVKQVSYSQEKCKKGYEKTQITLTWE